MTQGRTKIISNKETQGINKMNQVIRNWIKDKD